MSLDLALYSDNGGRYRLPSPFEQVVFSTTRKGPGGLTAFAPLSKMEAFRLRHNSGLLYAVLSDGADVVWSGRVEGKAVVKGGVKISAYGLARAFDDVLYTALWSKSTTADWREVSGDELANSAPALYEMDNNNRLFIGLKKSANYNNVAKLGRMVYELPDKGSRDAATISCDYSIVVTASFGACAISIEGYDDDWTLVESEDIAASITTSDSGTFSHTFAAGVTKVAFQFRRQNASDVEYTGETGETYGRLTNVRIKSTTAATVLSSAIAQALYEYVDSVNPTLLAGSRIQATSLDLRQEIYEDARPSEILDNLALRESYVWGVDEHGVFYWQPRSTVGRRWVVDALDIEVEDDLDAIHNQAYAVYQDANDRRLRTDPAENTISVRIYGVRRQRSIDARTTSQAQAASHRDALLNDTSFYAIRAEIDFEAIYDEQGNRGELWQVKGGDRVTIRNLPSLYSLDNDALASFIVERAMYESATNRLTLEPTLPIPTVAVLLANAGGGGAAMAAGGGMSSLSDAPGGVSGMPFIDPAVAGNLAVQTAEGGLVDAGYAASVAPTPDSVVLRDEYGRIEIESVDFGLAAIRAYSVGTAAIGVHGETIGGSTYGVYGKSSGPGTAAGVYGEGVGSTRGGRFRSDSGTGAFSESVSGTYAHQFRDNTTAVSGIQRTTGNLVFLGASAAANRNAQLKELFASIPTSDPAVAGELWRDGDTIKISNG